MMSYYCRYHSFFVWNSLRRNLNLYYWEDSGEIFLQALIILVIFRISANFCFESYWVLQSSCKVLFAIPRVTFADNCWIIGYSSESRSYCIQKLAGSEKNLKCWKTLKNTFILMFAGILSFFVFSILWGRVIWCHLVQFNIR